MTHKPVSLVETLRWRALNQPHQLAYRFLVDGEYDEVVLTYEDLDQRARSIGALLQSSASAGDRVLILLPPGLDFIAAYFGCLYAKMLAIPVYPPHPARLSLNLPIIRRIAADAEPAVALLSSSLFDAINCRIDISTELGNMHLIAIGNEGIDYRAEQWKQTEIGLGDIAYLQYTSGSTTIPKGVMISHGNLLHNLGLIENSFGQSKESHAVIWLPPYHDMGLIGGILQPLYSGYPVTLIPHMMFLQNPFRWLQAISRFRATTSGGPNFAYDLCIGKIKPEQREKLDLSSWEVAFNGAEPIYHKTLDQFADYFAPCGFRREAFLPCYGLAESTLLVVSAPKGKTPLVKYLVNTGLDQNRAIISPEMTDDTRALVSCGKNVSDQKIKIVNVETQVTCHPNEVGEIWISGPSVSGGYWNKPAESDFTFGARLSGNNEGPFLRSGDIGFLHEEELYIVGRLKNLIISGGKNHYSQDIERTVEASHFSIRPAGSAVFSLYNDGSEDIIIVAELERKFPVRGEVIIKAIREAVSVQHGLHVHDIKLTKPGGIPRTTSGKIRHFLCKQYYVAGTLKEIETT